MPDTCTVFINGRPVSLPAGALVIDALRHAAPDLIEACERGEAFVRDGRDLPLTLDGPLVAGAILRTARSSRRGPADA
jgi:hypothetical protein